MVLNQRSLLLPPMILMAQLTSQVPWDHQETPMPATLPLTSTHTSTLNLDQPPPPRGLPRPVHPPICCPSYLHHLPQLETPTCPLVVAAGSFSLVWGLQVPTTLCIPPPTIIPTTQAHRVAPPGSRGRDRPLTCLGLSCLRERPSLSLSLTSFPLWLGTLALGLVSTDRSLPVCRTPWWWGRERRGVGSVPPGSRGRPCKSTPPPVLTVLPV